MRSGHIKAVGLDISFFDFEEALKIALDRRGIAKVDQIEPVFRKSAKSF